MEPLTPLEKRIQDSHEWAIDRIHLLTENRCEDDAYSIVEEFSEWINPKDVEHDIFSLEYIGEGSAYD